MPVALLPINLTYEQAVVEPFMRARRALLSHIASYTLAFVPALVWLAGEIDAAVARWLEALRPGDLFVLTADHGIPPVPERVKALAAEVRAETARPNRSRTYGAAQRDPGPGCSVGRPGSC